MYVCVYVGFLLFLKATSNIWIKYLIFHKKYLSNHQINVKKTTLMEKEKASKCEALKNRYINLS